MEAVVTCSRCLNRGPIGPKRVYCPKCGAPLEAGPELPPKRLELPGGKLFVEDRLAFGDLCNLYRCRLDGQHRAGVFKIARSAAANAHVAREARMLRRLRDADADRRFAPFLPELSASMSYANGDGEPERQANVLLYHDGVDDPGQLYSIEQVRGAYPGGLDARDMAWMWRRLLTILGFVHRLDIAHGAITPDHILIEPREHKLILIGWSAAAPFGMLPHLASQRWQAIRTEPGRPRPSAASASGDLGCAARSMQWLLGSDAEPAVVRHLERAATASDAVRLLDDFDKMIGALWGPRRFRPFEMPRSG